MDSRDLENRMWAEACEMLERAERLQRQFFRPAVRARRPVWEPPIDIYETDQALWILAALPGVGPNQVEVVLETGAIVIRGERRLPLESHEGIFRRLEIPHGRFERRIALPGSRYEMVRRELLDGCLYIALHKG
ncbi:MAG TPA: Hsp20/alpha crystallin family protein [Gammaproteobacteria bacterium]|jgi:HSP20 family molecular chaperone IbpA|nr:Hsp20/alpha crystallin family protein [Gammaproteobacteria bacterium]HET7587208.1 Hsp20/alpha crystallin family protein [Gammaproteobacteria bacterium]